MQSNIPQEFLDYARRLLGDTRFEKFSNSLSEQPSVSLRTNPFKSIASRLSESDISLYDSQVPWATDGIYLKSRPPFTFDPLFHAGAYYVQEASSMFLEQAVRKYVDSPVTALDLCAAPGGKSTHLRSLLPEGSLLVSNEPIRNRAQVLAENMIKWGHPDVVVTNNYPDSFASLPCFFDLMVTDVPCSGEGMFRKEEDAVTGWSMDAVMQCRDRQREILRDVWPALRPGGLLIYSTCTLNQYEDEENVSWIANELGAEVLSLDTDESWGVQGNLLSGSGVSFEGRGAEANDVYHFVQGMARGEGFFLAVLRKHGSDDEECIDYTGDASLKSRSRKKNSKTKENPVPSECRGWVSGDADMEFVSDGNTVTACKSCHASRISLLRSTLKVLHAGIPVAELKGKDWIPLHALSMSASLNPAAFPQVELSYEQAISYLRKESVVLPPSTPKGIVLLCYDNVPLGFAKQIGNRANNMYPQEWKIRSSYTQPFCIKNDIL